MLVLLEPFLRRMSDTHSDVEATKVLGEAAHAFGFRSAYLIQYASKLSMIQRVIDSDTSRRTWWSTFFASDLRPSPREVAAMLQNGQLLRLDPSRFGPGTEKLRAVMETWDLLDVVAVPISHDGELVGAAGFCGVTEMDRPKETALTLLAYAAFAFQRSALPDRDGDEVSLTTREREVITLAARGLTSEQMASELRMSARTANQHMDNVAEKLGTRNRAHTVAEAIHRKLI